MKHCPNVECPHFRATGTPAEYVVEGAECADCGGPLQEGPPPENAAEDRSIAPPLVRRLGVTLLAILALPALSWAALPGLDLDTIKRFDTPDRLRPFGNLTVFALGLSPLVSAAIVVGLVTLVVPRWRDLCGTEAGGRKIGRATLVLTVLLCLFQSFGVARLLANLPDVYDGSTPVVMLTLTTGTMLLVAAAALLSRHGIANGFSILIGGSLLLTEIDGLVCFVLARRTEPILPLSMFLLAAAPVAAALGLARALSPRRGVASGAPSGEAVAAYRLQAAPHGGEPAPVGGPLFVRAPASGIWPLAAAELVVEFPRIAGVQVASLARRDLAFDVVYVGGVMVLTVLFTYVMHMPARVARARRAGVREAADPAEDEAAVKAARADVRAAAIRSAALVGVVLAAARVAEQSLGHFPSAATLFILTAIGLDMAAEWRARRAHGELAVVLSAHDIDATDAAARALAGAGIAVLARGAHHRSMLQALGPYVPVELMVPPDHAAEARRIVERFAPVKDAERPAAAEMPRASRRARVRR